VHVCLRLDGVPLAIELAAARVAAMSPTELLEGLEQRFETLAGGRRRAVQRHQTLRAAIDWSYDLLSEHERRLLARLAVFAGGCTRQAAEAVCGAEPLAPGKVFGLLVTLVAKSLVVAQRDGPETRYRLLETIREYSEERLAAIDETEVLRAEHAEYYCQFAFGLDQELLGPRQGVAGRRLAAEYENLLAAINHAVDVGNVDLALRLVRNSWHPTEQFGYRLLLPLDAVLGLPGVGDHPLYPFGVAAAAHTAASRGDLTHAATGCDEALAAARRLGSDGDHLVEYVVCSARGTRAVAMGAWDEAAAHVERGAELGRPVDRPPWSVEVALAGAAIAHAMAGNPDAAVRLASEGVDLARKVGGPTGVTINLVALAAALADRDPAQARALLAESLELRTTLDFETPWSATQSTLIAARIGEWPLVLELAPSAIRHLYWAGDRPFLAGIFNIVAHALAPSDPASAAVLQGAVPRLAPATVGTPHAVPPTASGAISPSGPVRSPASFITELRRQTTASLNESLREARVRQLRTEGAAMDDAHIVAYALDAIGRAQKDAEASEGAALSAEEAIAYAQRGRGERKRPATGWASLTPTECDVIRLVSEGLANKDIATRLFVSPRTVQTHLTHVYTKLGLTSRVQLAQEAGRHP
jgi:DNA-binding CsgD family transcriptional regulator